ncbi:MAG: TatD family hydrolase [Dongiaceae bacterium]
MIIDSHCHLDYPPLVDDLNGVLARAKNAGVSHMLTICTKLSEFPRVQKIAEENEQIFCSVGIHPHNAASEKKVSAEELVTLANHPKVIGIGEAGLDYYYDHSPRDVQKEQFLTHIAASRTVQLPLIVHTRDADEDTAAIIENEMKKGAFPCLLHCFTGGMELAKRGIAAGCYISFSGIATYKNAENLREVVKMAPLERILVETDAPYLAPVPQRGKPNEPAFIVHTLALLAELKGLSPKEMANQTSANFTRLFSKAKIAS